MGELSSLWMLTGCSLWTNKTTSAVHSGSPQRVELHIWYGRLTWTDKNVPPDTILSGFGSPLWIFCCSAKCVNHCTVVLLHEWNTCCVFWNDISSLGCFFEVTIAVIWHYIERTEFNWIIQKLIMTAEVSCNSALHWVALCWVANFWSWSLEAVKFWSSHSCGFFFVCFLPFAFFNDFIDSYIFSSVFLTTTKNGRESQYFICFYNGWHPM